MHSTLDRSPESIQPFDFDGHDVRTMMIEDEPWFVLGDVCKVLEIGNVTDAKKRLDQLDFDSIEVQNVRGQMVQTVIINESGLYDVILDSRKPQAKQFRRWVTSEVIPSIRKTGSYGTQPAIPQTYAEALRLAADAHDRANELEAKVEADAPKVDYHDTYVADEDLIQFRTLANQIEFGEQDLKRLLVDRKWIYNDRTHRWSNTEERLVGENRWRAHAGKKKYFRLIPNHKVPRINGEVRQTLKVTPHGATAIARLVERLRDADPTQELPDQPEIEFTEDDRNLKVVK